MRIHRIRLCALRHPEWFYLACRFTSPRYDTLSTRVRSSVCQLCSLAVFRSCSFTWDEAKFSVTGFYEDVYQRCLDALRGLGGKISSDDPNAGQKVAKTGVSGKTWGDIMGKTWGDIIQVGVHRTSGLQTPVKVMVSQRVKGTLWDWGRNQEFAVLNSDLARRKPSLSCPAAGR